MSSMILGYTATEPVEEATVAQMAAAAAQSFRPRDWWVEALEIVYDKKSRKLAGSTRLFLGDYSLPGGRYVVVPQDEEYLLICADTSFIVARLSEWSAEFNVSWRIEMDGNIVGEITGGKPSTQLNKLMDGICSMSKLSPDRIPELLKKHAARKD